MAVNSLGYRKWSGKLAWPGMRIVVIATTGIRRAWQSSWLRRLLFLSWLPAIWFAVGFFLYEKSIEFPEMIEGLAPFLRNSVQNPQMAEVLDLIETGNPGDARHGVWAWLLQSFFRYPQGVVMALVVGLIAPPLVSQDIRSRAFLLYFSRPMGRAEYMLGKLITVWAYLAMISMFPALVLYVMGVLLSPEVGVVAATWDLPLRIIGATMVLSIPTASLALCLSSLTQESRTAAFAWFAILILGWVTFGVLSTVEGIDQLANEEFTSFNGESVWSHFSLYHTLGRVQSWLFGFLKFRDVFTSALILIVITLVSSGVLLRRVTAPMRA